MLKVKQWKAVKHVGACHMDGRANDGWTVEGPEYVPDYEHPMLQEDDAKMMADAPRMRKEIKALNGRLEMMERKLALQEELTATWRATAQISGDKVDHLTVENTQAKEAIATLSEGKPLGDIVGKHLIENYQHRLENQASTIDSFRTQLAQEKNINGFLQTEALTLQTKVKGLTASDTARGERIVRLKALLKKADNDLEEIIHNLEGAKTAWEQERNVSDMQAVRISLLGTENAGLVGHSQNLKDRNSYLEHDRAEFKAKLLEWVKENAPGGWIDALRVNLSIQTKAADHWMGEANKDHNELVKIRNALGNYNAPTMSLSWLVESLVIGIGHEMQFKENYKHDLEVVEGGVSDLIAALRHCYDRACAVFVKPPMTYEAWLAAIKTEME